MPTARPSGAASRRDRGCGRRVQRCRRDRRRERPSHRPTNQRHHGRLSQKSRPEGTVPVGGEAAPRADMGHRCRPSTLMIRDDFTRRTSIIIDDVLLGRGSERSRAGSWQRSAWAKRAARRGNRRLRHCRTDRDPKCPSRTHVAWAAGADQVHVSPKRVNCERAESLGRRGRNALESGRACATPQTVAMCPLPGQAPQQEHLHPIIGRRSWAPSDHASGCSNDQQMRSKQPTEHVPRRRERCIPRCTALGGTIEPLCVLSI